MALSSRLWQFSHYCEDEMKTNQRPMVELTETETNQVAGGAGRHYGQLAKQQGVPAWSINSGNAANAPGHNK
jgi:hypothetical protein